MNFRICLGISGRYRVFSRTHAVVSGDSAGLFRDRPADCSKFLRSRALQRNATRAVESGFSPVVEVQYNNAA